MTVAMLDHGHKETVDNVGIQDEQLADRITSRIDSTCQESWLLA